MYGTGNGSNGKERTGRQGAAVERSGLAGKARRG